ncbi:MAG: hypothetical protein EA398_12260 [Deltaproteobacteria bacterium]|nr:MAG: hypothetical protein EA398_12260 [Deltaproteobacteria bacterium]
MVTWQPPADVDQIMVFRDGMLVAELPATSEVFVDDDAPEAGSPRITGVPHATTDLRDLVEVSWNPAVTSGDPVSYIVVSSVGGVLSVPAPAVIGSRGGPPVQRYLVEARGEWVDVGVDTAWSDTEAEEGTITIATASASFDRTDGVRLTATLEVLPGAWQTYMVRAVNALGTSEPTVAVEGRRAEPVVPVIRWQWSPNETPYQYTTLANSDQLIVDDTGIAVGESRRYRIIVGGDFNGSEYLGGGLVRGAGVGSRVGE